MPSLVTVSRILPTDLGMRHVDVFIDSVRVGMLIWLFGAGPMYVDLERLD